VEVQLDGCLIVETCIPSSGNCGRGKSLNHIDPAANRWRRKIGDGVLHLPRKYTRAGRRLLERRISTPGEGGAVRQRWE
jgi:hypothetical protein